MSEKFIWFYFIRKKTAFIKQQSYGSLQNGFVPSIPYKQLVVNDGLPILNISRFCGGCSSNFMDTLICTCVFAKAWPEAPSWVFYVNFACCICRSSSVVRPQCTAEARMYYIVANFKWWYPQHFFSLQASSMASWDLRKLSNVSPVSRRVYVLFCFLWSALWLDISVDRKISKWVQVVVEISTKF